MSALRAASRAFYVLAMVMFVWFAVRTMTGVVAAMDGVAVLGLLLAAAGLLCDAYSVKDQS